jgi:two-component system sensor histidine kinase AlgZ
MRLRNGLYWLCQICGWGAYSAVGLWVAVLDHGWRRSAVYGYILFFLYCIALTHLLRGMIRRRKWITLPLPRALARLAVASLVIGAIQRTLVIGVYTAIEGSLGEWSDRSSIAFLFMGVSIATTVWTVLYLAITTMRHSREVRQNQMQMKLELSNAELRALEAQINPHFLFNCLNSIRGMIVEDTVQAQDMVTKLANILRYSLQRNRKHTVPLEVEVEAVSDYLALESIRFEDRLQVRVELAQEARRTEIPAMLVQTLVENAIKHGVEHVRGQGMVSIRAALEGDRLRIEVENSGILQEPPQNSTQIGLANARERLRILYSERASLSLLPSGKERVKATVLIPVEP